MRLQFLIGASSALLLGGSALAQAPAPNAAAPAAPASPSAPVNPATPQAPVNPATPATPAIPGAPGSPSAAATAEPPATQADPSARSTGYNARTSGSASAGASTDVAGLLKAGTMVKDSSGATVGKISGVSSNSSSVTIKVGSKMLTVPASSLSANGKMLVAQQSKADLLAQGSQP